MAAPAHPFWIEWDRDHRDRRSARLSVDGRVVGYLLRVRWIHAEGWSHTLRSDDHIFGRLADALADAARCVEGPATRPGEGSRNGVQTRKMV